MLQDSTKGLLIKMVVSLERTGDAGWDDHAESGRECLYEMHQMTRPAFRAYRNDNAETRWRTRLPDAAKLNRAMPHVKLMVSAIRRQDRVMALASGRAALAEM
jgi:hypothetical protein